MKKVLKSIFLVVFVSLIFCGSSYASILWYNGDFDGRNGLANQLGTSSSPARVYDNFIVGPGGWTVNSVWSNNLMNFSASAVMWEIRSGLSNHNAGTLVASGGGTGFFTQIATGRSGFGYTEYTTTVSGINLNLAPGTYWLNVVPVGSGNQWSYMSTTSGANAIGQPAGNDVNSFFDSSYFGENFTLNYSNLRDFSMGIAGVGGNQVVPEPATLGLLGLGIFGLARRKFFRKA